ncbi:hypothetical protein [Lysinibacillus sp. NPDC092081]|uniref:hypothetical protein n=1 Tax=Lysinibacillus sp. NPDC092081 TaxID=3364131 RepID=UPI00380AF4D8
MLWRLDEGDFRVRLLLWASVEPLPSLKLLLHFRKKISVAAAAASLSRKNICRCRFAFAQKHLPLPLRFRAKTSVALKPPAD